MQIQQKANCNALVITTAIELQYKQTTQYKLQKLNNYQNHPESKY